MEDLFPKNYRADDINIIKSQIKQGLKSTTYYLNGVGKNPFCFLLKKKLDSDPEFTVYEIDSLRTNFDETSLMSEVLKLLAIEYDERVISNNQFKDLVRLALSKSQKKLVLILNIDYCKDFNSQVFRFIRQVREIDKTKIITTIHLYWSYSVARKIANSDNYDLFNGVINYHKPFSEDAFEQALYYFQKKNRSLSSDEKVLFWKISGGIPRIYKQAYFFALEEGISILQEGFMERFVASSRFKNYFLVLNKDFNGELINWVNSFDRHQLLQKLGIMKKGKIISGALRLKIAQTDNLNHIIKNPGSYTLSEQKILKSLIPNKIITRETIAIALWGKNYLNKYSDYAIDRHITNIRAKLKGNSNCEVQSIKGIGFILKTS